MDQTRGLGYWVLIIGSILLLIMLIAGQMMAFINYDLAVSLGLQESGTTVGARGVAMNKGFGLGDTIIYTPLMVIGVWGLFAGKRIGYYCMIGAMAITAYWPMVSLFILIFSKGGPDFNFTDLGVYTVLLTLITLFGLWGMYYLYDKVRSIW